MNEVRGGTGSRGNPAPRRALSRVRPLDAEDAGGTQASPASGPEDAALAVDSQAAAPGGTQGRDLLIPGRGTGRGKNGRQVPSVADLMPQAAPSGRRRSSDHGGAGHGKALPGKGSAKPADKDGSKGLKVVGLEVPLTKPVRKRLKARAAELGMSPEQTVAQLVEVWLEG